jgi:uncharacterized protein YbdZ (MbtH family)
MNRSDADRDDTNVYRVVVNDEEQYSIWLDYKPNAPGWRDAGPKGTKAECLAYIKQVWTDMTPLSLRKKMAEFAKNPPPESPSRPDADAPHEKSLVDRLAEGDHPVEMGLKPEKNVKAFKEAIDRDFVHVRFTQTRGGTELGIRLDRNRSNFSQADFGSGQGTAHLEGDVTLDYVKVKCIADVELSTLEGRGRLIRIEDVA